MTVEFDYLVVEGETCDRCSDSRDGVRAAVADARTMLPASAVEVALVERELSADRLADSNRVLVNGLPAEEWLGGTSAISSCPSCSNLLDAPVCCREVEVGGVTTSALSRELVLDAIMAAAGLAPAGVPGVNCCGGDAAASAGSDAASEDSTEGPDGDAAPCCPAREPTTVTLVTGPGCG